MHFNCIDRQSKALDTRWAPKIASETIMSPIVAMSQVLHTSPVD